MADLYLVEFKGSRKGYFYNTYYHTLKVEDYVIVQADQGEDMGLLTLKINAEINFSDSAKPRSILRPAGEDDGETRLGQGESGGSADARAATRDQANGAHDPPAPIEPPSSSST